MSTSRHIGIVAVSAEGAALCYRTICAEAVDLMGAQNHPEITMHTFPLGDYMAHVESGRWDEVGNLLLSSAEKLTKTGVELLICPDNTVHQGLDLVRESSPIPIGCLEISLPAFIGNSLPALTSGLAEGCGTRSIGNHPCAAHVADRH